MANTFREQERVEPISGSEPKKGVQMEAEDAGPSKVKFDEAVRNADPSKVERRDIPAGVEPATSEAVKRQSLIQLASAPGPSEPPKVTPTPKDLEGQAADLRRQLERPRAVLLDSSTTTVLSPADVAKLSGHLEHVDQGLRDVSRLTKGVEIGSALTEEKPVAVRFLKFLTESDRRLGGFVDEIKGINTGERRLTPEVLLAVQVKFGFIQNELEFFTTTLNKALESTKTIMNVQI